MRRLYLRIYLAVVASLAVFALLAGAAWHSFGEPTWSGETIATVARNLLPPAAASVAEQQATLERLSRDLSIDLALFGATGQRLAAVGERIEAPQRAGRQGGAFRDRPVWAVRLEDGRWLAARVPHRGRPGAGLVFIALILIAIAVGAYPAVRRLTARLERLQRGVQALGEGNLAARVSVEGRDEVARLAEAFNHSAQRIERLVAANRQVLANASHELRTPLARIRMAIELLKEGVDPARKAALERDIAELDALIEEILLASRLDAVDRLDTTEPVDLTALAAEEAARYDIEVAGSAGVVRGDPRLLRRMVRNLLENAKRHGAPPVTVTVERTGETVELAVCDGGPGVREAHRERIFEPFYTGARGAGLGLSIVRQIARRHGGEARCEGNCFVVNLPAAS